MQSSAGICEATALIFHLQTLGCKTNQYESQGIREMLLAAGHAETPAPEKADLCVVNTCAVTVRADASCRNAVSSIIRTNPRARIIITGCAVDLEQEWLTSFPEVTHVVPNTFKATIAALAQEEEVDDKPPDDFFFAITGFEGHTRAFIKVQDGCNCFCSYCTVPYARGTPRSRDAGSILDEARALIDNGYRELIVTGINIGEYESVEGERLHDLVAAVAQLPGLARLRLSSIEPLCITDELLRVIADFPHVCPHLHIPLQSGDDTILEAMNRRYRSRDYLHLLDKVREAIDRPAITTDVIVGFPGEGPVEFANSFELCRRADFSRTHIFLYSPRPGTPAGKLLQMTPDRVIKERKDDLREMASVSAHSFASSFLGETVSVIVEKPVMGKLSGYTERYIKVIFDGDDSIVGTTQQITAVSVLEGTIDGKLSPP